MPAGSVYLSIGSAAVTAVGAAALFASGFLPHSVTSTTGKIDGIFSVSSKDSTQKGLTKVAEQGSTEGLDTYLHQRDWLLGLPPQIAEHVLAALDESSLSALRLVSKSTCLHVAARTTRLSVNIDGSSCSFTGPLLGDVYPRLQELRLVPTGPNAGSSLHAYLTASYAAPQLAKLRLLDLSQMAPNMMDRATWQALIMCLGGSTVLRIPWRSLPGAADIATHSGPTPGPDAACVLPALDLFAALRPNCCIELEGSRVPLPVRTGASLQSLCGLRGLLRALPLTLAPSLAPLSAHVGALSALTRLTSLELKYREEGDNPMPQLLRALAAPVPMKRLVVSRVNHLVNERDLALLAQLPSLTCLEVAGLRAMGGEALPPLRAVTRLAVRTERLDLMQPLGLFFPTLSHLELGYGEDEGHSRSHWRGAGTRLPEAFSSLVHAPPPTQPEGPEALLNLRPLVGLAGLRTLVLGGRPAVGHESLATLTGLTRLVLRRCSEFRPLRKAVEELRSLACLTHMEMYACTGGEACGYEIARLLRRLQKLPGLVLCVVDGCDPRLSQQLGTAPLLRMSQLALLRQPHLTPLDLKHVAQAQTGLHELLVHECDLLDRKVCVALPGASNRLQLKVLLL